MFLNNEFQSQAQRAINAVAEVLSKDKKDKESLEIARVADAILTTLFMGLDGLGRTYERLADGTEKLVEFAAVDIEATIEHEVARRADNIATGAVEAHIKSASERSFIGKPT